MLDKNMENLQKNMRKNDFPSTGNGSTVTATIRYFGSFRETVNRNEEHVSVRLNLTVYQLLHELASRYGAAFREEVFSDDGSLRDDLMVSVNETLANQAKIGNAKVADGDVITLLPIFLGGG